MQSITSLQRRVAVQRAEISSWLETASAGLRKTFPAEVGRAEAWMAQQEDVEAVGMSRSASSLRAVRERLAQRTEIGAELRTELTEALSERADQLGRAMEARLGAIQDERGAHVELWDSWGMAAVPESDRLLQQGRSLLASEDYPALATLLDRTQLLLENSRAEVEQLEERHQRRLYLLKSLRQVCVDLGMTEQTPPRFEREGDRRSRIQLAVNSHNQGKLAFWLSLEGISSFADADSDRCFHEFGELSKQLESDFGIETELRMEDGAEPPRRLHRGEQELPGDEGLGASQGEA
ncbi:MAG: hypothetical protein KDA61_03735 [Planctomycetales bacterium]|nr:hypothetical protein [Planctomycetales bacterium]